MDKAIKIIGIVTDGIDQPRNDGTFGSGLYKIPFELNRTPSYEWIELFVNAWNHPPQFTSMHRSGIASVFGNQIILDGTTIEEVEKYHKGTLNLAVEVANNQIAEMNLRKQEQAKMETKKREKHQKNIDYINKRIDFN